MLVALRVRSEVICVASGVTLCRGASVARIIVAVPTQEYVVSRMTLGAHILFTLTVLFSLHERPGLAAHASSAQYSVGDWVLSHPVVFRAVAWMRQRNQSAIAGFAPPPCRGYQFGNPTTKKVFKRGRKVLHFDKLSAKLSGSGFPLE